MAQQEASERLLNRIRTLVAEVEELRAAGASEIRVRARRREIAGLQWRLAEIVSRTASGEVLGRA